ANGASTMGAPIRDSFTRRDGKAEWKSLSDQGTADKLGLAAYVPVEPSPVTIMGIMKAAAAQSGRRLAALPSGTLAVEKVADVHLEVSGQSRDVSLYALTGMSLEPVYSWASAGPEMAFFAFILPGWMQVIESGWESAAPTLERRQVEFDNKGLRD